MAHDVRGMTARPDRQRRATTWVVIGVGAVLAIVATVLGVNLLADLPTGTVPTATESLVASATSEPNGTPPSSASAPSSPAHTASSWTATGAMIEARSQYTATLLAGGKVLVAGGNSSSSGDLLGSAELYDP